MAIAGSLESIQKDIEKIINNSLLAKNGVTLMAACKTQPASVIEEAIKAGITHFGENRVQEAEEKWPALKQRYPTIQLHLIGPLQTNKVKEAVALFDVIQTVDRVKLADSLSATMAKAGKFPACYIQVNTGKEPQKAGVMPQEADQLIEYCRKQLQLPIAGLMCVPPHDQPSAPHFALLKQIAERHGLTGLSMGMSDDYKEAVRMGATCIRLGRILFGERN